MVISKEDVFARVKKVIVEEINAKEDEIELTTSFTEDLGADSLDVVQLVMDFEDEFDIEIPDDDVEQIRTVGNAVDYISSKLESKDA
ncbi:MAG: acyl carrier protein [Candidatus Nitrosotenuis sp.]